MIDKFDYPRPTDLAMGAPSPKVLGSGAGNDQRMWAFCAERLDKIADELLASAVLWAGVPNVEGVWIRLTATTARVVSSDALFLVDGQLLAPYTTSTPVPRSRELCSKHSFRPGSWTSSFLPTWAARAPET